MLNFDSELKAYVLPPFKRNNERDKTHAYALWLQLSMLVAKYNSNCVDFRFIFIVLNFSASMEPKKIKSKEIVFQYLICAAAHIIPRRSQDP